MISNHIRADRDKDILPAFGKLIKTQRHIQLVINSFSKFNIGNFAAFMLFKGFTVNKITTPSSDSGLLRLPQTDKTRLKSISIMTLPMSKYKVYHPSGLMNYFFYPQSTFRTE